MSECPHCHQEIDIKVLVDRALLMLGHGNGRVDAAIDPEGLGYSVKRTAKHYLNEARVDLEAVSSLLGRDRE